MNNNKILATSIVDHLAYACDLTKIMEEHGIDTDSLVNEIEYIISTVIN